MQQSEKFWNKAAAKYARSKIGDIDAYNYTLDRTRSYLTPTDRVLEVGCGTGSTALILAGHVAHITASDLSSNMIGIAEEKAGDQQVRNVSFIAGDLFHADLGDGPYDAVLALNLLHLLEDTTGAIRRINALLKPDGVFISKTVCRPSSGFSLKFRFIRAVVPIMQFLGKAPYVNFMDAAELEGVIVDAGFEILEAGDHPPPSRYIVARKVGG